MTSNYQIYYIITKYFNHYTQPSIQYYGNEQLLPIKINGRKKLCGNTIINFDIGGYQITPWNNNNKK